LSNTTISVNTENKRQFTPVRPVIESPLTNYYPELALARTP